MAGAHPATHSHWQGLLPPARPAGWEVSVVCPRMRGEEGDETWRTGTGRVSPLPLLALDFRVYA